MRRHSHALGALAAYSVLTLALTWPLARGLGRDVPGDFGDPLLNVWIVAWDADHLERAVAGHPAALGDYWNATIFAPHPLALAYSEHLTAQALQVLPIHVLSRNPILSYNLLFLSTFILSAWGMFLLVRELTGNSAAAFLAGLAFGFAPYRIASIPHLQVLSSAWMPFTLFGFRRFFVTLAAGDASPAGSGRRCIPPLAGGASAWIAENLSCGYYLLFFSPIVALYLAWEFTMRGLWGDRKTVIRVGSMIVAVVIVTAPFLMPYVELRRLGFIPRSIAETAKFSADVYGYFTADPGLRVWGHIARAWPTPEGSLFPGLTTATLAAIAIVGAWRQTQGPTPPTTATRLLGWSFAVASAAAIVVLLGGSIRIPARRPLLKIANFARERALAAGIGVALLALSAQARMRARRLLVSPVGLFASATLFAAAMSLGPDIYSRGRVVEQGALYATFYRFVPGFDGLRVPARFGMIVALGLAALAGHGAAMIGRWRNGRWLVVAASVLVVVESCAAPIPTNQNDTNYKQRGVAALPGALAVADAALPVYAFAAQLPEASVLLELPAGEPAFDVRYMLYALPHGRALVNGYSGGAPTDYLLLTEALNETLTRPDDAWRALTASAATHVIVHEAAYEPGRGRRISAWLAAHRAREIAAFGDDRVFVLP